MSSQFARVVVGLGLEREFDYLVPQTLQARLKAGCRVLVPFGRQKLTAYVIALSDSSDFRGNTGT